MKVLTSKHAYGTHERQSLTAYVPEGGKNLPGLLMVHGGYWAQESGMGSWPGKFAAKGWAVFAVRYRLNSQALWPAQRDDVLGALEWILKRPKTFGVDPDRIVALGSSAGGHLAVQAGIFADEIRAVAALSAPLSPLRAYEDGFDPTGSWAEKKARLRAEAQKLAGCVPDKTKNSCWQQWRDMECTQHITGDESPVWLGYFTDDLVLPTHGEEYLERHQAERTDQGTVTLAKMSGRGHAMNLMDVPGVAIGVRDFLAAHAALK